VGATVGATVAAGAQAASSIESTITAIRILNKLERMLLSPYKILKWLSNNNDVQNCTPFKTQKAKSPP
jgi:hypothetical protein